MKIFLTGANGFLGKQIIADLAGRGHELVLFSRRQPDARWARFEWIQGDCNDLAACIKAMAGKKIDGVMHVAALPSPTDVKGTPQFDDIAHVSDTMQTNVMGLYNMLQAALRAEIPVFVQTGSNCVMGHERRISAAPPHFQYLPLDEAHPCEPEDSYSVSKACNEIQLKAFAAYGMKTYALRSGWILDAERRDMVANKRAAQPTEDIRKVFNSYIAQEDCSMAHVLLIEAAHAGRLPGHDCYYLHADDSLAPEPSMELLQKFRPDLLDKLREPLPGFAPFFSNRKLKTAIDWKPALTWRTHRLGRLG
jgi:UDP-glucose 4-epimerase